MNLGQRGGQTVFAAAMPPGIYHDVQLAIAGQNFIATVEVSGSQAQDGRTKTHIGSYTIFDLTREKLGRSTVLHLPLSNFRFLHFRVEGPLTPDRVLGITVLRTAPGEPKYLTVAAGSSFTQQGHDSVIEFNVPAHTPADRVVFVPAPGAGEFSRDVQISVRQAKPPRAINSEELQPPAQTFGNILRIHRVADGRPINEERLIVNVPFIAPSGAATRWTVTVKNGDDKPVPIRSVRLEMMEREICFPAAAASGYTLYYGDSALIPPQYDYATLFTRQPNAALANTGPELPNPQYEPRPDSRPFTDRHPLLLWAALALVILLLAAIALRSAKRTMPTAQ